MEFGLRSCCACALIEEMPMTIAVAKMPVLRFKFMMPVTLQMVFTIISIIRCVRNGSDQWDIISHIAER